MKRTDPKLLVDIINEAMQADGIATRVNEQRVAYLWPEVVGPGINRYTTRRYVAGGILHVYLSSAALKQELSFHRQRLTEALNKAVGDHVITDVALH